MLNIQILITVGLFGIASLAFQFPQRSIQAFHPLRSIPADGKPCEYIEVCFSPFSKDCKRRGAKKTYEYFIKMAEDIEGIEEVASECMDECTSGPNVRFDRDDKRIMGCVKGAPKIAEILGVEVSSSS